MANGIKIPVSIENNAQQGLRSVHNSVTNFYSQINEYLTLAPKIDSRNFEENLRNLKNQLDFIHKYSSGVVKGLSVDIGKYSYVGKNNNGKEAVINKVLSNGLKGKKKEVYDLQNAFLDPNALKSAYSAISKALGKKLYTNPETENLARQFVIDAETVLKSWKPVFSAVDKYLQAPTKQHDKKKAQLEATFNSAEASDAVKAMKEREKAQKRLIELDKSQSEIRKMLGTYDTNLYTDVRKKLTAEQQLVKILNEQAALYTIIGDKAKAAGAKGRATRMLTQAEDTTARLINWTGNDKGLIASYTPQNVKRQIDSISRDLTNSIGREGILGKYLDVQGWDESVSRIKKSISEVEKTFTIGGKKFKIAGFDDALKALGQIDKMASKGIRNAAQWQQKLNEYIAAHVDVANKYQVEQNKILQSQKKEARQDDDKLERWKLQNEINKGIDDELQRRKEQKKLDDERERQILREQATAEKEANDKKKRIQAETDELRRVNNQRMAEWARKTDSRANNFQKGGSSSQELANMRQYYKEQEESAKKLASIEQQIAKERRRNVRGGGSLESSIYRQIDLYKKLAQASKEAGNAQREEYAKSKIRQLEGQANAIGRINALFGRQGQILTGLRGIAAQYFSIYAVANFARKVAETTGYFQQQQVALEGILGSASKARSVLSDIKNFALQSPFQTKELVRFTKQLSAFGIGSNDLFPTVKSLADISAGLGVDMDRIILAYGQVKSAAVLRGQELRQFTEAGIPMVDRLAKKFTELNGKLVTTADVFKLISERKVPFEMVASVLNDMTKEGGQFYKMQENITDTTYGQIQKMRDLWTLAMDEIGRSTGDFINSIIKGIQEIIKNIKPIGGILIATFSLRSLGQFIQSGYLAIRALKGMRVAAMAARGAFATLGGWLGMIIGLIGGLVWSWRSNANKLNDAMNEVEKTFTKDTNKMTDGIYSLVKKLKNATVGTKAFSDAVSTLTANYGSYLSADITEALAKQGDEASKAAHRFIELADSIKETIRQEQKWKMLQEQGKEAAGLAGEKAGEDTNKETSTNFFTGFVKTDILSEIKSSRVTETGISYTTGLLDGVKRFLEENNGVKEEDLRKSVSELFGNVFYEIANEGESFEDSKSRIKEVFKDRVSETFDIDDETLGIIADKAISSLTDKAIDNFNKAAEKYALANSTIYAQLVKPFEELDKRISDGDLETGIDDIDAAFNKYNEAFKVLSESMWNHYNGSRTTPKFEGYNDDNNEAAKRLRTLLESNEHNASSAYEVVEAIREFSKSNDDTTFVRSLNILSTRFQQYVQLRTKFAARVTDSFLNPNLEVYKWRSDETLKNVALRYGNPTDDDFWRKREELVKDYEKAQKDIDKLDRVKGVKRDTLWAERRSELVKQRDAYKTLMGVDYYGASTDKGQGSGSRGGWRRMFSDLFGWVKEAYKEEKNLAEGTAGYTSALFKQINSDKLADTAVRAFWASDKSPFAKFFASAKEYGLESDIFNEQFLTNALGKVITEVRDNGNDIDSVDYKKVYNSLLGLISNRADELEKSGNMKAADDLRVYLQQMTVERDKFFGGEEVNKLIEDQLKQLREINNHLANTEKIQSAYERLYKTDTDYKATYGALGFAGRYQRFRPDLETENALGQVFSSGEGKGIAEELSKNADYGRLIKIITSAGSLDIQNLRTLYDMMGSIQNTKGIDGVDAEPFKRAKESILPLIDKLIEAIIKEQEARANAVGTLEKANIKENDIRERLANRLDAIDKYYQKKLQELETDDKLSPNKKRDKKNTLNEQWQDSKADAKFDELGEIMNNLGGTLSENLRGFKDAEGGMSKLGWAVLFSQGGLADKFKSAGAAAVQSDKMSAAEAAEMVQGANSAIAVIDMIFKLIDDIFKVTKDVLNRLEEIDKNNYRINKGNTSRDSRTGQVTINGYDYGAAYNKRMAAFEVFDNFNTNAQKGWEAMKSGNFIGAIYNGFIKQIMDLPIMLAKLADTDIQNEQDGLIRSNEALERAMKSLEHELNKAVGNSKFTKMTEQAANLENQRANMQSIYDLELSKKGTDEDKLQEYSDKIADLDRQIEDMYDNIRTTIFGTADEVAQRLTDPLVEAFRNGTNAARSWRDAVKNYISDVLKEVLLTNVIAPRIDQILKSFGIEKGKTSGDDILKIMSDAGKMTALRAQLFEEGNKLIDVFNGLAPAIQEMIAVNTNTSDLQGGIQSVTEDTGRSLEGLANSQLAQLVLINKTLSQSAFAEVQLSWFNDMLVQQIALRQAADNIYNAIEDMRTGTRPLSVAISS